MRSLVLASVAVSVQLCAEAPAPPAEVDTILADPGAALAIDANDGVDEAFRSTVRDVFRRPTSYRWVWAAKAEDNPVLALLEILEGRGVPAPVARVLAYAAAEPDAVKATAPLDLAGVVPLDDSVAGTVILLPERDLWRVPVERAGVVLGRATAIPCLAALEVPQPDYPLGPLPPVLACKALESWATR